MKISHPSSTMTTNGASKEDTSNEIVAEFSKKDVLYVKIFSLPPQQLVWSQINTIATVQNIVTQIVYKKLINSISS